MKRFGLLLAFLGLISAAPVASALVIRTGVDGGGSVLASGVIDPFWTISTQGGAFASARVLYDDQICCSMETVGAQAAWISDPSIQDGSSATDWGLFTDAVLRRTFDLTAAEAAVASITGTWRLADYTMGIFLNGNLIAGTDIGTGGNDQAFGTWFSDHAFAAGSALFVAGTNTLEIRGQSLNSSFDGLWLDANVVAAAVPVPSSLLLLALGFVGLVARSRKAS